MGARLTNRERGEFIHISECHYHTKSPSFTPCNDMSPNQAKTKLALEICNFYE